MRCVRADARTPKFGWPLGQARTKGLGYMVIVGVRRSVCWQEAIGTIHRIAVLGRGMRIIRCRIRMRIMARAVGYGQKGWSPYKDTRLNHISLSEQSGKIRKRCNAWASKINLKVRVMDNIK